MEQDRLNGRFLIYLVAEGLNGKKADRIWDSVDMAAVLKNAKRQKTGALVFSGMEADLISDADMRQKISRENDIAMWIHSLQEIERDRIYRAFEEKGIRFMPLKGLIMKEIYPFGYLRTMSDLDILIDEENAFAVREVMESLGYTTERFGQRYHDKYLNGKGMLVEIHLSLVDRDGSSGKMNNGFDNAWDGKLITADENNSSMYRQIPEEFYIYMVAHAAKHFFSSGFGVRFVIDIGVYRKKFKDRLDYEYIKDRFKQMEILKFAETVGELADIWLDEDTELEAEDIFDKDNISEDRQKDLLMMEESLFSTSLYGDSSQRAAARADESTAVPKSKHTLTFLAAFKRIFPQKKYMKIDYPILNKYAFLLPFCWAVRIVKWVFIKNRNLKREITAIKDIDYDNLEFKRRMKEY